MMGLKTYRSSYSIVVNALRAIDCNEIICAIVIKALRAMLICVIMYNHPVELYNTARLDYKLYHFAIQTGWIAPVLRRR